MKKLQLNAGLKATEILSREHLKRILGGAYSDGSDGIDGYCNARRECTSGCATFTDASMQHGYCSNCCYA